MSESLFKGPLDIATSINHEAAELDSVANDHVTSQYELDELKSELNLLNMQHPLIGRKVSIFGDTLVPSIDADNNVHPLSLPPGGPRPVPEGIYSGLNVQKAYNPDSDAFEFRVVHVLAHEEYEYFDEFGHQHVVTPCTYICAPGSEIVPDEPYDAHSLRYLEKDTIAEDFDAIVYADEDSVFKMLKQISKLARSSLQEHSDNQERVRHLVSYFNSVGIFKDISICTRDIAIGSNGGKLMVSDLSEVYVVTPQIFEWQHEYIRDVKKGGIKVADSHDLYINGVLENGRSVLAPVKSIISVH